MSITEYLKSRPKSQAQKDWEKMEREIKRKSRRPITLEELQEQYKKRKNVLDLIEEMNEKENL